MSNKNSVLGFFSVSDGLHTCGFKFCVCRQSQIFFLSAYFLPELYSTNTYVPINVEDPVLDAKNLTLENQTSWIAWYLAVKGNREGTLIEK